MTPEQQSTTTSSSNLSLYTGGNEEVKKIANRYIILHKIFFGMGINVLIIIIAGIIARNISAADLTIPYPMRDADMKSKEFKLIQDFSSIESKSYKDNDVRVIIKQGPLSIDNQYLTTTNNLITYQGYVVPRTAKISIASTQIKPITYFNNSGYDVRFLDMYLNNFILNNYKDQNTLFQENNLLPLQTSVPQQFELQCLLSPKITNIFCQKAFDSSINSIPLYNLKQDYAGLSTLSSAVQGTSYAPKFCESIKKYIFFSNDSEKEIKDIMVSCGKEYEDSVGDFVSFRSIQDQLNRESISSTVTSSTLLNIYKLLSTQQDIYYDIIVGKNINTTRINGYNAYVEALLKESDKMQPFYFDVVARYNNTFLIPEITKASITTRGDAGDDYKRLLDQMKKINQGDSIARHTGLIGHIINPTLLSSGTFTIMTGTTITNVVDTFTKNYSFSDFIVRSTSGIDEKTLFVSGLLRFTTNAGLANNSPMNAKFMYTNQRFYVQSIELPRHPAIAALINPKLTLQPLPISEVYNLIVANSKVTANQDVCTSFKSDKSMTRCSTTQATFVQNKIQYTFNYTTTNGVSSYTISDSLLDKSVKGVYGNSISITKNPVDAIRLVLAYRVPDTTNTTTPSPSIGGTKEIQIQKDFDTIDAKITKISELKGYTIVEFSLKDYKYTSIYDATKKNILGLGIIINGTTYPIRNFSFSFATAKPEEVELLKNDPATFLLQKDPLTVKKLGLK